MAAFSSACVLTCERTAELLGLDVRTLREMTDAAVIRAVRRGSGKTRAYTEGDIRAYLMESESPPCQSTSRKKGASGNTTSGTRVIDFTARRDRKRGATPKP